MGSRSANDAPKIAVVVNTLNEERNLPACLRSVVAWASDIVVVDMHSTDATKAIAERYGARFFLTEPLGFVEPAREFAVAQALHDWVLILDADEMATRDLADELLRIAAADEADVVRIPRLNYFFGARVEHCGWSPAEDSQWRFFKKGKLDLGGHIHRSLQPLPGARVKELEAAGERHIVHFNYLTMAQFVEKLNRYTSIEATQAVERGESISARRAVESAFKEWRRRYFTKKGRQDGWRGLYLALSMAFYRLATAAKLQELREVGGEDEVRERYRQVAEDVLAPYGSDAAPRLPKSAAK